MNGKLLVTTRTGTEYRVDFDARTVEWADGRRYSDAEVAALHVGRRMLYRGHCNQLEGIYTRYTTEVVSIEPIAEDKS